MAKSEDIQAAIDTANHLLEKIKQVDVDAVISSFGWDNKQIMLAVEDGVEEFKKNFKARLKEGSAKLSAVNSISELRLVCDNEDHDIYGVTAKLLEEKGYVLILTLVRENGKYWFDHLTFTDLKTYNQFTLLWQA
jgi:predicted DNA binding protein